MVEDLLVDPWQISSPDQVTPRLNGGLCRRQGGRILLRLSHRLCGLTAYGQQKPTRHHRTFAPSNAAGELRRDRSMEGEPKYALYPVPGNFRSGGRKTPKIFAHLWCAAGGSTDFS